MGASVLLAVRHFYFRPSYSTSFLNCPTDSSGHISPLSPVHFLHIPKTGGSSLENALFRNNVSVSTHRWQQIEREPPYDIMSDFNCSSWHIPPTSTLPNSFTFVREPLDRLESEFKDCFRVRNPTCARYSMDSPGFEKWVKEILSRAAAQPDINDCHIIPQWKFAEKTTFIIPFTCLKQLSTWSMIGKFYGLKDLQHSRERAQAKPLGVVSPEVVQLVHEFYSTDYSRLSRHFPTGIKVIRS
jgi:hypothetical protein